MCNGYSEPVKRIFTSDDLKKWIMSDSYKLTLDFIVELQEQIVGLTNDSEVVTSEVSEKLLNILSKVNDIIERNPVVKDKDTSRFGKIEFRDFYDQVSTESENMIKLLLENHPEKYGAIVELKAYFNVSWGDRIRIDYGSGHELNFMLFLLCLQKLDIIKKSDYPCLVLKVFTKYISIMRIIQKIYWLEPAGSHGVWGLDDYHFLPFLFGASQLANHPHMRPKLIHIEELVECYYKKYMYFECIHFINNIKSVPCNQNQKLSLRLHSPMLDDILSVKSWHKIKEGMIKMFKAEVISKLPIVQHIKFGSLIRCPDGIEQFDDNSDEENSCKHTHTPGVINTWGDCCGIKIPSAIAASESLKLMEKQKLK